MRTLCNDLRRVVPNAVRINRGKLGREGVSERALEIGADRVIVVERWKGGSGVIKLYTLPSTSEAFSALYLAGIKTQDEIGRRKTVREGLMVTVEKNASPPTRHLADLFSKFLRVPLLEDLQKNTGFRASAHFSNFQGSGVKISFTMPPIINEIGPTLIVRYPIDSRPGEDLLE